MVINSMIFYKNKTIAGWFVLFDILFVTHGLIPALNIFYSLILFLIIAISLLYFYIVNKEYGQSHFIRSLNLLVALFTIYGIYNIINPIEATFYILPDYRPYTYITNAYRPLLQIYPLYYFARKGYIDEEVIKSWVVPSFIAVGFAFYVNNMKTLSMSTLSSIEQTSNTGYLVASLFPLLFFLKDDLLKYILLAFAIFFVFICAKRGAMVIAVISALWFLLYNLKSTKSYSKIKILVLIAVIGLILYRYIYAIFEESYYLNYLLEKTQSGDSSGRDDLFSKAWIHFSEKSSFVNFLFGYGADSTYSILGNRAHNDWLELLINQGLIGFLIYAYLWIQLVKLWLKSKTNRFMYFVFGLIVTSFFMKTMFSMLYNDLSSIACLPFAWCIASIDKQNRFVRKKSLI